MCWGLSSRQNRACPGPTAPDTHLALSWSVSWMEPNPVVGLLHWALTAIVLVGRGAGGLLPSWASPACQPGRVATIWSTCPVRFLHKTLGRWNFILLAKGWFCSFSRVVTSQKCHDGQVIKENSIMMIALNRKHGKLLQQWSSKQNIDTSLGVVQALIRNAFFYLHQSNQWVQCFYFFLMHVLRWRKCLQTWFCYTNAHHIFMVYF